MYRKSTADIELQEFDFIDFGCKKGSSFSFCEDVLGGKRGLGIDNNPVYVEEFCEAGGRAIVADAAQTGLPGDTVRFVCVSHLLEHLPSLDVVEKVVLEAIRIASDFVCVVGPYFDADAYLRSKDMKFYWSDWSWHPPKPSIQFYKPIYLEMVFLISIKEIPDKISILKKLKLARKLDV